MIAMERDWVPVLASNGLGSAYTITHINAVMRRIDLTCKLVAPIVISVVISTTSVPIGVQAVGGMSLVSWGIEILSANHVWATSPQLRLSKATHRQPHDRNTRPINLTSVLGARFYSACSRWSGNLRVYFSTDVCIPSLALAVLHTSALSYSATFITFLLNSGFSLLLITIARTIGSCFEISSTFMMPLGVEYLAHTKEITQQIPESSLFLAGQDEEPNERGQSSQKQAAEQHGIGLVRTGLWGIMLQLTSLVRDTDQHISIC